MKQEYGTKEWFEELFALSDSDDPWGHNWRGSQKYRFDIYKQLLSKSTSFVNERSVPMNILDIGCAMGDFTLQLNKKYPDAKMTGIDLSEIAIQKAQKRFPKIEFKVASLPVTGLPYNSFSLITCLEVLNYFDEKGQEEALKEIQNLLKENGKILFSSVIGEKPYFKPNGFIDLISKYFVIETVEYYHNKIYFKIESIFLGIHVKLRTIEMLLKLKDREFEEYIKKIKNSKNQYKVKVIEMFRNNSMKVISIGIIRFIDQMVKTVFGLKIFSRICHSVSKHFAISKSHTFVIAVKKA